MIPEHTLIHYLRDKKNIPYGVLVAVKSSSGYRLGYSQCRRSDRFSKEMALKIAIGRANEDSWPTPDVLPQDVRKATGAFIERCNRYYKFEYGVPT